MTLGTPATARRSIAVANYDHVTVAPSNSSSRGRTRDGRAKPEVAAPGTNIASSNALGDGRADNAGQLRPVRTKKTGTGMSPARRRHPGAAVPEEAGPHGRAGAQHPGGVGQRTAGGGAVRHRLGLLGRVDAEVAIRLVDLVD